jgi:hypothetical protein
VKAPILDLMMGGHMGLIIDRLWFACPNEKAVQFLLLITPTWLDQ